VQGDGYEPVSQAVILAGGKAQRLRPLTDDRPKAMVEIAGRPIIEHQLRWLAENGLRDILISLGHQAEVLQEYVGDGSRLGVQVEYAVEPEPLGRGGGLRFAAARLADGRTFVAVNGDVICRFSLRDMIEFHERLGVSATVALASYRSTWGVVDIDGDLITGFKQSPQLPYWINAGVYVLEPEIVARLPKRGDHEDTTFPELASDGRLAGFHIHGYWRGIDTLKDVAEATSELERLPGTPSQHQSFAAALDVRPLARADAQALSAAFAAIGWTKPAEQFVRYATEADNGTRTSWVATVNGEMAGCVTLLWESDYPGIARLGIPEIRDLNVLPQFRRRGIASAMLDRAEGAAARRSAVVAIGVGLHPGYNAAQVLYVKRGYIPDGLGVTYGDRFVQEGESLPFDDSLVLHFTKKLGPGSAS